MVKIQDKIQKLKKMLAEESRDYQNLWKGYYFFSINLQDLLEQFDQIGDDDEKIDKHRDKVEEALTLYNQAKTYLARHFDTFVTEYEGKPINSHNSQPVSCFSLPPELMDGGSHIWLEDHVYRQFGYKDVLNPKTKNHYIRDGRFLFLKIDLSYDKKSILDEVDDLIQHVQQKLIGKDTDSEIAHKHHLFDNIFSKMTDIETRDDALEAVSEKMEGALGSPINVDSLRRRYYPAWKQRHGVKDWKEWRTRQGEDT